jgi:hypothetical protein
MDEVSSSGSAELLEDRTLEIEFDNHHGDEAILRAERALSSTACSAAAGEAGTSAS